MMAATKPSQIRDPAVLLWRIPENSVANTNTGILKAPTIMKIKKIWGRFSWWRQIIRPAIVMIFSDIVSYIFSLFCFPTRRQRHVCFIETPSTLGEGIWKQRFHSENASNVFRSHYTGGIWKRRFHSENPSNVFRPHYAGGIWIQKRFHSENTSHVFCPHYVVRI